nr:hypothetical protein [Tanacetum cinerariifolium]
MFDIDYLTDSLNYSRVSSTNLTAVVPIVDEATTQNNGKEEADRLRLAFPSLNLILCVGTASIGSSVSTGNTPQISPCASPISAGRPTGSAGESVSAGNPNGSAGRPGSTGRPTGSAGRPVSAGRPTGSTSRPVSAGRPTGSAGRPVSAGHPTDSAGRPISAGRPFGSAARTPILAEEPTTVAQALADPDWVEAMQAEMQ